MKFNFSDNECAWTLTQGHEVFSSFQNFSVVLFLKNNASIILIPHVSEGAWPLSRLPTG